MATGTRRATGRPVATAASEIFDRAGSIVMVLSAAGAPGRLSGPAHYSRPMHLKRVIPCLDVDAGRVVKGTNFVDIRDAGRSRRARRALRRRGRRRARLPRHHRDERQARHGRRARAARGGRVLHPVHDRRRDPLGGGCPGRARRRRRQGLGELRRGRAAGAHLRARRRLRGAMRRAGDRRQAHGRRRARAVGGLRRRRAHRRPAATSSSGRARACSAARGRSC